jgi:predicted DNA-binding ribbon-helix-helix protein
MDIRDSSEPSRKWQAPKAIAAPRLRRGVPIHGEGFVDQRMPQIITRTLLLDGEETELSLETAFWDALMLVADDQRSSVSAMIELASDGTEARDLSSAVRLFVLDYYRRRMRR